VAASLAFASAAAAHSVCEEVPTITHFALAEVTPAGAAVEAEIDPHGAETDYEIAIVWQAIKPPHGEPPSTGIGKQEGQIAAGSGAVTVRALLSGLQPGRIYWYEVFALNEGGEVLTGAQMFGYFYTGGFPEGSGQAPYRTTGESCRAIESGKLASEETVREQRELEAKEQQEREPATPQKEGPTVVAHPTRCLVPDLHSDSLRTAQATLLRAHCRLGKVRRPRHHRGALVVTGQSQTQGRELAQGTYVSLELGPIRRRRRP
jgi:hypothetical protein